MADSTVMLPRDHQVFMDYLIDHIVAPATPHPDFPESLQGGIEINETLVKMVLAKVMAEQPENLHHAVITLMTAWGIASEAAFP